MAPLGEILDRLGVDTSTLSRLYEVSGLPVYRLVTSGETAEELWHRLRGVVKETGHWPLVLPEVAENDVPEAAPQQIIEQGLHLDVPKWLKERLDDLLPEDEPAAAEASAEAAASHEFTLPFDILTGKPRPAVSIALLPTTTPWEVPAFFQFGGWNECPYPHEHLAVMKRWYDFYGAEPFGISSDVVEMFVRRPPVDLQQAMVLAREQYAYCADIVDQGTETVERLAAGLLRASAWFFWWD